MNGINVARKVLAEGVHCFRLRQGQDVIAPPAGARGLKHWAQPQPLEYDARPWPGGRKRGWVLLDAFTASAIVQVAEGLGNQGNREMFERFPIQIMAKCAWALIGKQSRGGQGNAG